MTPDPMTDLLTHMFPDLNIKQIRDKYPEAERWVLQFQVFTIKSLSSVFDKHVIWNQEEIQKALHEKAKWVDPYYAMCYPNKTRPNKVDLGPSRMAMTEDWP